MLQRYKMIIQYDGSPFYGWQMQDNVVTVQGDLEWALLPLGDGKRIKVIGAGRTDTGVHAFGQVAHFDLDTRLPLDEIQNAINARTQAGIEVLSLEAVNDDFHARFSARKRYYIYQVYTGKSLLYRNQSWHIPLFKIDNLNAIAALTLGEHDFLSISKYNPELDHTLCTVYESQWTKSGSMITFHIRANRFLHHMVRYLVGTMVAVGQGKFTREEFLHLLNNPQRNVRIFKAPPNGLILKQVSYD